MRLALAVSPLTQTRLLSARSLGGGKASTFIVAGRAGAPTVGVASVIVYVTVTGVSRPGSLKIYPTGRTVPSAVIASHLANQPGNAGVRLGLGTDGRLTVLNNATRAGNVTVDIVGYVRS